MAHQNNMHLRVSVAQYFHHPRHQRQRSGRLASRRSTSLRTGRKATTRGCPPVVEEDFTVTPKLKVTANTVCPVSWAFSRKSNNTFTRPYKSYSIL